MTRKKLLRLAIETIGLQSPRGRLLFFGIVSVAVFLAPYAWLSHLSLWQYLGIPAPSIGLTRAYWLILHGDIIGAYERNKLIYLILLIGLPLLAKDVMTLMKQRKGYNKP